MGKKERIFLFCNWGISRLITLILVFEVPSLLLLLPILWLLGNDMSHRYYIQFNVTTRTSLKHKDVRCQSVCWCIPLSGQVVFLLISECLVVSTSVCIPVSFLLVCLSHLFLALLSTYVYSVIAYA